MSDYGFWSRSLHRIALGIPSVTEATFDLERARFSARAESDVDARHVFVAGLARSGTTILMRSLYDTGEFCSLTYRDMPFVLAPNTWQGIADRGSTSKAASDRAHGDGIKVDFDSPEALEEVFWRIQSGDTYILDDRLKQMPRSKTVIAHFREYVALILLRYQRQRYLSKNNNNILRLDSIMAAFPQALVLMPYRDPLIQAESLRRQHSRFVERGEGDRFSVAYMNWLVHHEFGAGHRPFEWSVEASRELDTASLDYWLTQWLCVYRHLSQTIARYPGRVLPVGYELLCRNTAGVWQALDEKLDLGGKSVPQLEERQRKPEAEVDPNLLQQAQSVYASLDDACASWWSA